MNEKPAPKKRAAVFIKAAFEASNSWQDVGENIPKSVPHIEADDQQQGAYIAQLPCEPTTNTSRIKRSPESKADSGEPDVGRV